MREEQAGRSESKPGLVFIGKDWEENELQSLYVCGDAYE